MTTRQTFTACLAGMAGGFAGNAILGALFTSPWVHGVLYDPAWQSRLFIEITPTRDVALSVAGLIVLSAAHGWLYRLFESVLPGRAVVRKGLFWGGVIWLMYWLPQEWFIYHTLLREPLVLNLFELVLLLVGSLVEGVVIAWIIARLRS